MRKVLPLPEPALNVVGMGLEFKGSGCRVQV